MGNEFPRLLNFFVWGIGGHILMEGGAIQAKERMERIGYQ